MVAPPRDIPGFFYDTAKRKYFRIEASHTAPSSSKYSAENVKRQKIEKQLADRAELVAVRKKSLVRRAKALQDPLIGGLLSRELGYRRQDQVVDSWSQGVSFKGSLTLSPVKLDIDRIAITSADKSGIASAFGVLGEVRDMARFLPVDECDNIMDDNHFETPESIQTNPARNLGDHPGCQVSSLTYHRPSDSLIMTTVNTTSPGDQRTVSYFVTDSPGTFNCMDGIALSQCTEPIMPRRPWKKTKLAVTTSSCPAPDELTNSIALIGSDQGLMTITSDNRLVWTHPAPHPKAIEETSEGPLSLSFLPHLNQTIILSGYRNNKITLTDLRARSPQQKSPSLWIRHKSSVAHVKAINAHQVLAAGPKNSMSIYDIRFLNHSSITSSSTIRPNRPNTPIVRFPAYLNTAHIHIGLDVDLELGIVAAASADRAQAQDGRVYLYSLETGRQLDCPVLATDLRHGKVIKAMQFSKQSGEEHASLYVGAGHEVRKFSFGRARAGDEWLVGEGGEDVEMKEGGRRRAVIWGSTRGGG